MIEWKSDKELFDLIKTELYIPVVGDVLDKYGKIHQFLPPQIQPTRDTDIIIGRPMPAIITVRMDRKSSCLDCLQNH